MENRPKAPIPINDLESYPNASSAAKKTEYQKEKHEPVISRSRVTMRKKSAWQKAKHRIFEQEGEEIKEHAITDVIVPAFKNVISTIVIDTIDQLLYGEIRHSSTINKTIGGSRYGNYVSYNSISSPRANSGSRYSVGGVSRARNYMALDDLYFETQWEANRLLASMRDILNDFSVISVADMYNLMTETDEDGNTRPVIVSPTYNEYGWFDLDPKVAYVTYDHGWLLRLPDPEYLRNGPRNKKELNK